MGTKKSKQTIITIGYSEGDLIITQGYGTSEEKKDDKTMIDGFVCIS